MPSDDQYGDLLSGQPAKTGLLPADDNHQGVRLGMDVVEGHRREDFGVTSASQMPDGGCSITICSAVWTTWKGVPTGAGRLSRSSSRGRQELPW